jgi:hypothetical protein
MKKLFKSRYIARLRQGSYVTLQRCGQLLLTARAAAVLSSHLCAHVSRHQAVARGHDPTTTRTSGHISPNKGPEAWVLVGPDEAHNGQDAVQRCTKDKLRTGGKNKERELQKHVISRHGKGRVPGAVASLACARSSGLALASVIVVKTRMALPTVDSAALTRLQPPRDLALKLRTTACGPSKRTGCDR